ncbi:hypothetical protein MKEN_00747700 [Mycena kentingensis (nom. inval.)]|nr:hypothetical protein MKEN_00747700 [Mycena kentingensis (nom. inval.)]
MDYLPQELVDKILESVQETKSLESCALVSRSFASSSQKRIFSSITLDARRIRAFSQLTAESPHVFRLVHCMVIRLGYYEADWNWVAFCDLVPRFTSLRRVSVIVSSAWSGYRTAAHRLLDAILALPSVTSVALSNFAFIDPVDLVKSLDACSTRLESLGLIWSLYSYSSEALTPSPSSWLTKTLRSLVCECTGPASVRPLVSMGRWHALTHLDATVNFPDAQPHLDQFLANCSELRSCRFGLYFDAPPPINMAPLVHLHTLEVVLCPPASRAQIDHLIAILVTAPSPSPLQRLIVAPFGGSTLPEIGLEKLEDLLLDEAGKFAHRFRAFDLVVLRDEVPEVSNTAYYRALLPRLDAKRLLHVELAKF